MLLWYILGDMDDYTEFTVKVKDGQQDITHTVHEWARTRAEANTKALIELGNLLGHSQLFIVG